MPSEVRVVGQKFYAKLNNGDNFDLNPSDFSLHLKGGVLEEIKAVFNIQVSWFHNLTNYNQLYDSSANTLRIEQSGLDFDNQGFSVGDSVKLSAAGGNANYTGDVTSLSTGEITLGNVVVTSGTASNGYSTGIAGEDPLTGLTPKTALNFDFGLIENNENINFLSKLTNETQTYVFEGIDHNSPLTFVDGKQKGKNKAGNFGECKVAFVGLTPDKDFQNPQNTTQEFQVEHIFKINPFFRDGEEDSVQGLDKAPLDLYNGSKSLKYVFKTDFRTVINNPNTSIIAEYDTQEGSVGYFGESFNGYDSDFSVENLSYDTKTQIDTSETTSVTYEIVSTNSNFNASTPIVIGHSSLVSSLEYVYNKDEDYNTVWNDEQIRLLADGSPVNNSIIQNCIVNVLSPNRLKVSFDTSFNASQSGRLETGQDYILYYNVFDEGTDVDSSNKVLNVADFNQYFKNTDVDGLFNFTKFEQFPHPLSFDGVNVGFSDSLTFNEGGQMLSCEFWVLNGHDQKTIDFDISILDKRDTTFTPLRSLSIDISDSIIVNDIKQIEIDSTRNYVLKEDDIFNYLKITTGENDGTKQFYTIEIGYKIPWQNWLELKNAPTDFYDKENPFFNGLNQKASNYSMKGTGVNTFVDGDGGTFEDSTVANWNLTLLGYSPGTPNQVGSGLFQSSINESNKGSYSAEVGLSAPSMNEANKSYDFFETDTLLDVVQDESYEVVYYIAAVTGGFSTEQIDNGAIFFAPKGYNEDDLIVDSFVITADNLSIDSDNLQWIKCRTYFKATSTGTIQLVLRENIQNNIVSGVGGMFFLDTVTLKQSNHEVRVLLKSKIDDTDYVLSSQEIKVFDYDEDDKIQDNYKCVINTYNEQGIKLNNNIIEENFTEFRAEFYPLVPPVITKSVDMTEVATDWVRFAHGNLYTFLDVPFETRRLGIWDNDQGNDTDTFRNTNNTIIRTKIANDLYTSTAAQILADQNLGAFYGCYSLVKYEFYEISGKMFSTSSDNDGLLYQIGFMVDEFGVEHTLSLAATTGGVAINNSYVSGDPSSDRWVYNPAGSESNCNWALIYDYGKKDYTILEQFFTTKAGLGWDVAGELNFGVKRSGDDITIDVDWTITGDNFNDTFNYNLNDNDFTEKFKGFSNIGFGFHSQNQGGFKDVVLTLAEDEFYSILRIDEENTQVDTSINELSTLIEAPENNLLKQIEGDDKVAKLSYDGEKFITQGLIETSKIKKGVTYKFSAEIRSKNLNA